MESRLNALSPLDGRYSNKLEKLRDIFSEKSLIKHRLMVEIKWLSKLADQIPDQVPWNEIIEKKLLKIVAEFSDEDAAAIKTIEEETNHDVKAVEYFIGKSLPDYPELVDFIHFGLTSEDVNNLAYALMIKKALNDSLFPAIENIKLYLNSLAKEHASVAMLAHTHGQPATPTTVGKEFANFYVRFQKLTEQLLRVDVEGKLNGAVGNFNALSLVVPDVYWEKVSEEFVKSLGLKWNLYTTQIEPHDYIANLCNELAHINTVVIGLSRDIWLYCSKDYFKQKAKPGEVGSSTMPHKVNPIDFENAEGNAGLANALLKHMSEKLPISRLQRDLSDSTVLRNIGVAFGYCDLAYQSLLVGLNKLLVNEEVLKRELDAHPEVLGEAIQTMMRFHHIEKPYEKMKELTRDKKVDEEVLHDFIKNKSGLPEAAQQRLFALKPHTYVGEAPKLAKKI